EPGHHAAVDVDPLRRGTNPVLDLGPLPYRDDAPVADCDRFGRGLQLVDRQHGSENDQVSRRHSTILAAGERFFEKIRNPCRFGAVAVRRDCEGPLKQQWTRPFPTRRRHTMSRYMLIMRVTPEGAAAFQDADIDFNEVIESM